MELVCERKCLNERACDLLGCCIFKHELVNNGNVYRFINGSGKISLKECVKAFQEIKPPKVTGKQIWADYKYQDLLSMQSRGIELVSLDDNGDWKRTTKKKKGKTIHPRIEKSFKAKYVPVYILKDGRMCELFGNLTQRIGYGAEKGQPVYYDKIEQKLVLEHFGTTVSYYYDTIIKMVDVYVI